MPGSSTPISHPLRNYNVDQLHRRLLVDVYGVDPNTVLSTNPKKSTTVQSKFDHSQELHEVAARLQDMKDLCASTLETLSDLKLEKDNIFPALDVAADIIHAGEK